MKDTITIAITGAAGQIGYSLIPAIASGSVFGMDQPVIFSLIDRPVALPMLAGVKMEIEDLAFPLVAAVTTTDDANLGFKDADYAIFLGAFPRLEGMERKDVMEQNVGIFYAQGSALSDNAKPTVKCLVVGNPANTNAAILSKAAPRIPPRNITALTRLDHNRAVSLLAAKVGCTLSEVEGVIIWGNHSSTQYPDVRHATAAGAPAMRRCDPAWIEGDFITTVQRRGAAIIAARKLSSAMSAAKAIADHLRDWVLGTGDKFVSMAVFPEGEYGLAASTICFSLPVKCRGGEYEVVKGLPLDAFSQGMFDRTRAELEEELALAQSLLWR